MPHLHLSRSDDRLIVRLGERAAGVPWAGVAALALQAHRRRDDPAGYGRALFDLVFANDALRGALDALPADARLYLTADDPIAAGLGWEYLRDRGGRLVASRLSLVRGLTPAERPAAGRDDPLADSQGLEIVAIPAAPVDDLRPLNTEEEWRRLVAAVQKAGRRLTLRRVRPPTLSRLERSLDPAAATVVYFMGHSTSADGRGLLSFEDERCRTRTADAADFADALTPGVIFVALNSCRSAVAAETTEFANIARGLVRRGVPYALGMQFVLPDEAALVFGEALFDLLLQGRAIEDAVRGARRALAQDARLVRLDPDWLAGVPVLYTARPEEAGPLSLARWLPEGRPAVDPDPERLAALCDLSALPAAAGFVGRSLEIGQVLDALLAADAPDFVAIHGLGGIGKTALARAVAERVGWRYGDRVLAFSFESLARRDEAQGTWQVDAQFAGRFYNRLARFYGLDPADYPTVADLQAAILQRRAYVTSLLVLDNVETLIQAQREHPAAAGLAGLAAFVGRLREGVGGVLLTTRIAPPADWGRCRTIPLGGLDEAAGATLFAGLLSPPRRAAAPEAERRRLSARVGGHPLSIRLLAGRFNEEAGGLAAFLDDLEAHLQRAGQSAPGSLEDPERQRTLYACLAYSVDRLTGAQRRALQQVAVFRSPFPADFGAAVIADEGEAAVRLQELVRLGLLTEGQRAFEDGSLTLLELHPVVRWYLAQRLPPPDKAAYRRHAEIYAALARQAYQPAGGYDTSPRVRALVQGSLDDLDQAVEQAWRRLPPDAAAALAFHRADLHQRLGNVGDALALLEEALEVYTRLGDVRERAVTLGKIADVLQARGQLDEALRILQEEALPAFERLGDVRERAVTLGKIADVLQARGQLDEALRIRQEEQLPVYERLGDVRARAVTLGKIADVLQARGQLDEALRIRQEEQLPVYERLGDVRARAVTLGQIADVLQARGQLDEALRIRQEEELPVYERLGDVRARAVTLGKIADVLQARGQLDEALRIRQEEELPVYERLGDVRARAVTLGKIADVLQARGQLDEALRIRQEEQLPVYERLGDVRERAVTLANYGQLLLTKGEARRGLAMLWEAAQILHDRGYAADAQTMRQLLAAVKAQALGPEAFDRLWQEAIGQPQPDWLQDLQAGAGPQRPPGWRLPEEQLRLLVANTVAVLTTMPERREEWRGAVAAVLAQAQAAGLEDLAALSQALLQLLAGQEADLPADNPYHAAWQQIREGMAAGGPPPAPEEHPSPVMAAIQAFVNAGSWEESRGIVEAQRDLLLGDEAAAIFEANIAHAVRAGAQQGADYLQQHLDLLRACRREGIAAAFAARTQARPADLPFDPDLIPQTAAALRGSPQEKLAHLQRISALLAQAQDPGLRAFLEAIQAALVGGDLAELGRRLSGVYAQAWQALAVAVSGDENTAVLSAIAHNTLAVLGPVPERRSEWRDALTSLRNQATAAGDRPMVAFVDAVLALLDAGGNPAGLGGGLAGVYAVVWQALVRALAQRPQGT